MSEKQLVRFFDFIMGDDLDFYEEYTVNLTDGEQERFFQDNPDFMLGLGEKCDRIYLLRDRIYREILRKVRELEGGKGKELWNSFF